MQSLETKEVECPRCGSNRIWKYLAMKQKWEINNNKAACGQCDFVSIVDHFSRTAEITRLRKEQQLAVKEKLERIWYEVENHLDRFDYFREALGYSKDGAYLVFKEVQGLIEKHLRELHDK